MKDMTDLLVRSGASISECGQYRYWLERQWGDEAPQVFIMLNPSTADADVDDPTIRRCMGFARDWGRGGIIVVNLFAYRATDPKELAKVDDPVGPENFYNIGMALLAARTQSYDGFVLCAWGSNSIAQKRSERLIHRAPYFDVPLRCLGTTKSGAPKHPLYIPKDQKPEPFGFNFEGAGT